MFTDLYLQTTNPKLFFSRLLNPNIIGKIVFSAIFHTAVYTLFFNLTSYIFFEKILTNYVNKRLIVSLFTIMFLGYFARFWHVKEIFKSYHYDLEKTRQHLDKLYITWIFIA
jgi:hypothetical protein